MSDYTDSPEGQAAWEQAERDAQVEAIELYTLRAEVAALREERDRLENDLADALDVQAGHGPTALSMLVADRDALREENARLAADGWCDACCGTGKPADGGECMCSGTGLASMAVTYLRVRLLEAEALLRARDELEADIKRFNERISGGAQEPTKE